MRLLKFILIAISCFELKIFALQRTSILTIDLPIQIDVKSESIYTKLLGIRKDGVFLVEIGNEKNQYRIVFDINGNTDGFEPKTSTNSFVNSLGTNFQPWITNSYTITNENAVSYFIKRIQNQEVIWTKNKIIEFKTFSTNGFLSSYEIRNKVNEEHYQLIDGNLRKVTESVVFGAPTTFVVKLGQIRQPIIYNTTNNPQRENLGGSINFTGEIFSTDESLFDSNLRFALGYRFLNNSMAISSENQFIGYRNNYTNQINFFLIEDEMLKDVRFPFQSNLKTTVSDKNIIVKLNNPEQTLLNIQSSTNLIDWNTFKTIQNEPSLEVIIPVGKPKEFIRAIE